MCDRCMRGMGVLVFIVGVLFLLRDLNVWNFWNIGAWTVIFILAGLAAATYGLCGCGDACGASCCAEKPAAKPKRK